MFGPSPPIDFSFLFLLFVFELISSCISRLFLFIYNYIYFTSIIPRPAKHSYKEGFEYEVIWVQNILSYNCLLLHDEKLLKSIYWMLLLFVFFFFHFALYLLHFKKKKKTKEWFPLSYMIHIHVGIYIYTHISVHLRTHIFETTS